MCVHHLLSPLARNSTVYLLVALICKFEDELFLNLSLKASSSNLAATNQIGPYFRIMHDPKGPPTA